MGAPFVRALVALALVSPPARVTAEDGFIELGPRVALYLDATNALTIDDVARDPGFARSPMLLAGLRAVIEELPGFVVVGQASDGVAALALLRGERPDIAVLDISCRSSTGSR